MRHSQGLPQVCQYVVITSSCRQLPELGHGIRLKATGTAYVSTSVCDEFTTAFASVDSRTEGAPLAVSKATVAQLTW